MTYAKPELVALSHAVEAILGSDKSAQFVPDSPEVDATTIGAYEADE